MRQKGESRGRDWTNHEVEKLLCLRADGVGFDEISEILGRSCNSVRGKWHFIKNQKGEKKAKSWSEEKTELLIELAETLPRTQLIITYNERAVKKGFSRRTLPSISKRLFVLGQSMKPACGWYNMTNTAIGLGFSRQKISNWMKAGLKVDNEGTHVYIRVDNLVKFILDHPTSLDGIPDEGLQWFIAILKEEKEMRGRLGRPDFVKSLIA